MRRRGKIRFLLAGVFLGFSLMPSSLWACAACFGASDSQLAIGMNWGIFSLLVVVVGVLGTIAAFFIYLARRAAMFSSSVPGELSPVTKRV